MASGPPDQPEEDRRSLRPSVGYRELQERLSRACERAAPPAGAPESSPGRNHWSSSSSSSCYRGDVEEGEEHRKRKGRLDGVLQSLRRAMHRLRQRHLQPQAKATLQGQVLVLEAELESYKQLSAAKKHAADLLKYELMESLYEQVTNQEKLQQQMIALELQLHDQRAAAIRGMRQLDTQLQRAVSEKQLLQRRLGRLLCMTHDVTILDYDDIVHEGCDVVPRLNQWHQDMKFCRRNDQPRRASH